MSHTVRASGVPPPAVFRPIGTLHKLTVAIRIAVGEQVAWPLPTQHRKAGNRPGTAGQVDCARKEIQIERRVVEPPAPSSPLAQHLPEQSLGLRHDGEVILVGRPPLCVSRRDHKGIDPQVKVEEVKEIDYRLGGIGIEKGRIRGYPKSSSLRLGYPRYRPLEDAGLPDRHIMQLSQPIEMDHPSKVR